MVRSGSTAATTFRALRVHVIDAVRICALPMLIALYRTLEESRNADVIHKTHLELMRERLAVWLRWFLQRKRYFTAMAALPHMAWPASLHAIRIA